MENNQKEHINNIIKKESLRMNENKIITENDTKDCNSESNLKECNSKQ
jgi:hypothetical protein